MNDDEALEACCRAVLSGRLRVSAHARQRMQERRVSGRDLRSAAEHPAGVSRGDNGCWRLHGPDVDGDELVVVIDLESECIVTLF